MQATNSWSRGINSDISKLKSPQDTYLEASNFKLVSGSGQSSFALENTKGNKAAFKLPDTINRIWKLDPQFYTGDLNIVIQGTFTGEPIQTITNIQNKSPKQVAEFLLSDTTVQTFVNLGYYTIQYNNDYVVIVGLDQDVLPALYGALASAPTVIGPLNPVLLVDFCTNTQIIGAINIKDKVGIYSTDNTNDPDTTTITSTGQIWEVTYDEDTNTILDLGVNGELVPSKHLKYHHNLNLTQFRKVSGEGRYETANYRCHYFTDNHNVLRLFNLAASNTFATPLDCLPVKPIHTTTVPVIQSINDGGFIKVGRIQYFYQLQSDLGTETTASQASKLISLFPSALSSSYQSIQGGSQGANSGKSVTIKIDNLDTQYDRIKVGYILWEAEALATVRYFFEGSVPPNGSVTLTHSGNETEVSSSLEQYRLLQAQFDICKGLTQKKNILLAYNTRNTPFDVDIDCRAYRFSSITGSNNAYLYEKEDSYGNPRFVINNAGLLSTYGSAYGTDTWEDIPEEADLINPYNNEDNNNSLNNSNWLTNSQFKYQTDGITLGGEGPVIKYEFVNSPQYDVDTLITGTTGLQFNNPLSGVNTNIAATNYTPGDGNTYPLPSGLNCSKNPYVSEVFNGYHRGEVYRFGIVFYDKKFQPSFTKWIGDVKFPMNTDGYYAHDWDTSNKLYKHELGIKFTLDTSSSQFQAIKDDISGWSYVRVKRKEADKTRLGTGVLNTCSLFNSQYLINTGVSGGGFGGGDLMQVDWNNVKYATFECPNFKFNKNNSFIAGDHIRYIGFVGTVMEGMWQPLGGNAGDSGVHKFYYRFENSSVSDVYEITGMLNAEVSKNRAVVQNNSSFQYSFVNMGEANGTTEEYEGWGGYTHVISSYNLAHNIYRPSSTIWNNGFGGLNIGQTTNEQRYRPYVSYERYLSNQYGLQWEVRQGQDYIGTGHFQTWDGTQTIQPTEVFGGDCLVSHFGFMKFDGNTNTTEGISGWDTWSQGATEGVWQIQFMPCEVDFDLELRQGFHAANKSGAGGEPYHDEYIYNEAYSQKDEAVVYQTRPYNFVEIEENPYRIWASQEKFDGEFPNAWAKWLSNEFLDVEGTFGPINRMILNRDKVFYYQDYAIGVTAIKEQQALNQDNSNALILGEGTVLQRYDYVSKTTGTKHQWAVVNTPKGNYHFDATLKKIFMLEEAGDQFGLTDLKGLNVKLQQTIQNSVKNLDLPLRDISVHGEWNPKFNEVYFTISDGYNERLSSHNHVLTNRLTVSYNELTQCFDSYHSFLPTMYHRVENHLLSIASNTDSSLYSKTMFEHDTGLYNVYYNTLYPSTLKFVFNGGQYATITKRFDILELITEVTNSLGVNVPLETISAIRVRNDYQDTGLITLTPQGTNPGAIKRHLRSWRINYFRDQSTNLPFLKDKFHIIELTFQNTTTANRRLVLNDIQTTFQPQAF